MIHDWELYSVHQDADPEVVRQNTEEAQGMVAWMRKMDLSPREPIATDESTEAHDCEETFCSSQSTSVQRGGYMLGILFFLPPYRCHIQSSCFQNTVCMWEKYT